MAGGEGGDKKICAITFSRKRALLDGKGREKKTVSRKNTPKNAGGKRSRPCAPFRPLAAENGKRAVSRNPVLLAFRRRRDYNQTV